MKERFLYQYDFGDNWEHQIRVEAIITSESSSSEPLCISGKRACPPEDCGGAWNFMAQKQHYSIWYIADRFREIVQLYHQPLKRSLDVEGRKQKLPATVHHQH